MQKNVCQLTCCSKLLCPSPLLPPPPDPLSECLILLNLCPSMFPPKRRNEEEEDWGTPLPSGGPTRK